MIFSLNTNRHPDNIIATQTQRYLVMRYIYLDCIEINNMI